MDAVLSVNAWNINGAYSSLFGNKLDQEGFFLSKVREMDFFAVCETWTRDSNFTIPYVCYFNRPANTLSKRRLVRSSGGISLFYRECYKLNLSKDLFICAVY